MMGSHDLVIHDMLIIFFRVSIRMMRQNGFSLILIQDRHPDIKFAIETDVNKVIPILDVLINNRNNMNTTTYHKSTYSDLLFNFDNLTAHFFKISLINV